MTQNRKDPLKENELANKITKDGSQVGNVVLLKGYIGYSGSPDIVRLYLNSDFDHYVSIRRSDIINTEEAPEDVLEFEGTYLWVSSDADITYVHCK